MESNLHRLVAIMFIDIVGYTRMMEKDEKRTLLILERNRKLQKSLIQRYEGMWIKEIGDATMSTFDSPTNAVLCAREIVERIEEESEYNVRIGIHLGEVSFLNSDVFGDGVNVAARIQTSARPGKIYISESVFDSIKNNSDINSEVVGERKLKNVEKPLYLYQILKKDEIPNRFRQFVNRNFTTKKVVLILAILLLVVGWIFQNQLFSVFAKRELNHRKTIAVLPLQYLGASEDMEIKGLEISAVVLQRLSFIEDLNVISARTMSQYMGSLKSPEAIANELRADYVLDGTIQENNTVFEINLQLFETSTRQNIWNELYRKSETSFLEIPKEVSTDMLRLIDVDIPNETLLKLKEDKMPDRKAFELLMEGEGISNRYHYQNDTIPILNAMQRVNDALRIDPNYRDAIGQMSYLLYSLCVINKGGKWCDSLNTYLNCNIQSDRDNARLHVVKGLKAKMENNPELLKSEMERALELEPNNPDALQELGDWYVSHGQLRKGLQLILRRFKINPGQFNLHTMAQIYSQIGDYLSQLDMNETADKFHKKAIEYDSANMFVLGRYCQNNNKIGHFETNFSIVEKWYSIDSNNINVAHFYAYTQLCLRNFDKAEKAYRKVESLVDAQSGYMMPQVYQWPLEMAMVLIEEGKEGEASMYLEISELQANWSGSKARIAAVKKDYDQMYAWLDSTELIYPSDLAFLPFFKEAREQKRFKQFMRTNEKKWAPDKPKILKILREEGWDPDQL
jgi:adenylate cyclase